MSKETWRKKRDAPGEKDNAATKGEWYNPGMTIRSEDRETKQMRNVLNTEKYSKLTWNTNQKDLNLSKSDTRSFRWFSLFWVGIVFLWGSAQLLLGDYLSFPFGGSIVVASGIGLQALPPNLAVPSQSPGNAPFYRTGLSHVSYTMGGICVALMVVQFCLHWICLSGNLQRRWYWFYFLFQGICVLAISSIWSDTIIEFGLVFPRAGHPRG